MTFRSPYLRIKLFTDCLNGIYILLMFANDSLMNKPLLLYKFWENSIPIRDKNSTMYSCLLGSPPKALKTIFLVNLPFPVCRKMVFLSSSQAAKMQMWSSVILLLWRNTIWRLKI